MAEGSGAGGVQTAKASRQPGARHVSHTPAACSCPGENARSWEALGGARPGQSSLSAGRGSRHHYIWAPSPLLNATGGSITLFCLEGVSAFRGASQDEAGLTRIFENDLYIRGWISPPNGLDALLAPLPASPLCNFSLLCPKPASLPFSSSSVHPEHPVTCSGPPQSCLYPCLHPYSWL